MKIDTVYFIGDSKKPAIIFIHGIGMNKDIWINPSSTRILGEKIPIQSFLRKKMKNKITKSEQKDDLQTIFHDLKQDGYTVITWSQKKPTGTIAEALIELREVLNKAKELTKGGIILIGHSRGGLIGRKYILKKDFSIKGLITISTPHKGTSIAKIARYLTPLISMISPLLPAGDRGTISFAIKRIHELLKSQALKELLPSSNFFKTLRDGPLDGIYYISVGGTNPTIFTSPRISIPDIFEKVIPQSLYPEEMKKGKGDGLVSAMSSRLPWSNEHYNFECNHAEILFDSKVRKKLTEAIRRIS